jgi:hypothetical protein
MRGTAPGRDRRITVQHSGVQSLGRHRELLAAYLLVAVLGALYATSAMLLPTGAFFVQDGAAKFLQVQGLAATGWRSDGVDDPARAVDPSGALSPLRPSFAGHFFYEREGQWHAKYSLPFAVLATIPYQVFGVRGLALVSVVPAIICLLAVLYAAQRLHVKRLWLAVLLVGACTPLPFYAVEFWEHTIALALALVALLCVLDDRPDRTGNLIVGGLAVGIGAWFRTELVYLAPAMGLAAFGSLRSDGVRAALIFGAAFTAGVLPHVVLNWLYTGSVISPQIGAELQVQARTDGMLAAIRGQVATAWTMLGPSRFQRGWLLLMPPSLFAVLLVWRWRGREAALHTGVFLLLCCTGVALLWGLRSTSIYNYPVDLLSAGGGVALSLLYLLCKPQDAKGRARAAKLAVMGSVFGALVLLTSPHFGGQQWGPRYLLPVYPVLALLGVLGLERLLETAPGRGRSAMVWASTAVIALSAGISLQGIGYAYAWRELHRETIGRLADVPPTVVATNTHVLPFTLASMIDRHTLLGVESPEQVKRLDKLLRRQRRHDLLWVSLNPPFPHNWQSSPHPPDLHHELERLGWRLAGTPEVDAGGYRYMRYRLGTP